jgi:hypothetical protein
MTVPLTSQIEMLKRARYLQSIACLIEDAQKHDELQQEAQTLLARAGLTAPARGD